MWADPIVSALETAATLLDRQLQDPGLSRGARSEIADGMSKVTAARLARDFEKREDRLVTPVDRW